MTKKELKAKRFRDLQRKLKSVAIDAGDQWGLWLKPAKNESERAEIMIGAVLVQRASWANATLALAQLRDCGLMDLKRIFVCDENDLAKLIKPAGCHTSKSRCLKSLAELVTRRYKTASAMMNAETVVLRQNLLSVKGIGFETADSILLYALEKPTMVVDEYTRRLAVDTWPKNAWPKASPPAAVDKKLYLFLKNVFEEALERDARVFQEIHARIVIYGQKNSGSKTAKPGRPTRGIQKR